MNDASNLCFGVKESCVFMDFTNFSITNNTTCDIMHDLFVGVCRYDMAQIINRLIKDKIITIRILNDRIRYFNYDSGTRNIPPPIKVHPVTSSYLIMSACTLCRILLAMEGDLAMETVKVQSKAEHSKLSMMRSKLQLKERPAVVDERSVL